MHKLVSTLKSIYKGDIINISKEINNNCLAFAKAVNSTTNYQDCGQINMQKREYDNYIGKLGEYGVYSFLKTLSKGLQFTIDEPDINIYNSKKKSWKSDLCIKQDDVTIDFAVKSQAWAQAKRYDFSGTFQIASFRKDSIFERPDELVFLALVDDRTDVKVLVMPPKQVSEIKFADPKLPKFKGLKLCYYAKDNFDDRNLKIVKAFLEK